MTWFDFLALNTRRTAIFGAIEELVEEVAESIRKAS